MRGGENLEGVICVNSEDEWESGKYGECDAGEDGEGGNRVNIYSPIVDHRGHPAFV